MFFKNYALKFVKLFLNSIDTLTFIMRSIFNLQEAWVMCACLVFLSRYLTLKNNTVRQFPASKFAQKEFYYLSCYNIQCHSVLALQRLQLMGSNSPRSPVALQGRRRIFEFRNITHPCNRCNFILYRIYQISPFFTESQGVLVQNT